MTFDQNRFDSDGFDGTVISYLNRADLYGLGNVDFARGHRVRKAVNLDCYGEGELGINPTVIRDNRAFLYGVGALAATPTRIRHRSAILYGIGDLVSSAMVGVEVTIKYNSTLSPGETLILDCQKFTAKKDGVNALGSISGDFPEINYGDNIVSYSDDDASRTALVTVLHRSRYV
jgi:hypothetical protein